MKPVVLGKPLMIVWFHLFNPSFLVLTHNVSQKENNAEYRFVMSGCS